MKRLPVLLLALSLCGCATLLQVAKSQFGQPKLSVRSVDITGLSLGSIAANIVCDVDNPNAFGLDLAGFDYQLTLDMKQLVGGKVTQGFNVPANGKGVVTFPVEFRFVEVGQAVLSLFRKEQVDYGVKTTLGFNSPIGVINVPLEHNGTFPVPRLPEISLAGAAAGSVNLTGATLRVRIGLKNRNNFPLPLGTFNYKLLIEGSEVSSGGVPAPTLAPNQSGTLELPVSINFLGSGGAIIKAIRSGRANIQLDGGLEIGGLGQVLPFHQETSVSLR